MIRSTIYLTLAAIFGGSTCPGITPVECPPKPADLEGEATAVSFDPGPDREPPSLDLPPSSPFVPCAPCLEAELVRLGLVLPPRIETLDDLFFYGAIPAGVVCAGGIHHMNWD
jgi:hypothetical protein